MVTPVTPGDPIHIDAPITATNDVYNYYVGLLILQYRALNNACSEILALATSFIQNQIVSQVRDGFNLTTALGAQLNLLGRYRGISRVLFGVVLATDWSLVPCNDPNPNTYSGWALAAGANPTWRWLQVNDLNSAAYSLSDAQMRLLISLTAAFQSSDGSLGNLDNILYSFFGAYVNMVDNGNMTITYYHQSSDPDPNSLWKIAVLAGVIPHPAGVNFSVIEV
jgi:hypothetical protein